MGHTPKSSELLNLDKAKQRILKQIISIKESERIPLIDSAGRVLAEDIISNIDLPPFHQSAVDGYAFRYNDYKKNNSLQITDTILAGRPTKLTCQAGECFKIMTGAMIPKGCDTIQMQENCSVTNNTIQIISPTKQGMFIRLKGNEVTKDSVLFPEGRRLGMVDLGLIASIGVAHVRVYRKPKVAVFSTGDELRSLGGELQDGQIFDANRYMLIALLNSAQIEAVDAGMISDDIAALTVMFREAAAYADMVITSGGVSVGEADCVRDVLEKEGTIDLWRIAIKPGKPFAFGFLNSHNPKKSDHVIFCGLPGNPVSSLVTFCQLVMPALERLSGATPKETVPIPATLTSPIKKVSKRQEFLRGYYESHHDGALAVKLSPNQNSSMLTSITQSNCFIVLSEDQADLKEGDQVFIEPFPAGWGI